MSDFPELGADVLARLAAVERTQAALIEGVGKALAGLTRLQATADRIEAAGADVVNTAGQVLVSMASLNHEVQAWSVDLTMLRGLVEQARTSRLGRALLGGG